MCGALALSLLDLEADVARQIRPMFVLHERFLNVRVPSVMKPACLVLRLVEARHAELVINFTLKAGGFPGTAEEHTQSRPLRFLAG